MMVVQQGASFFKRAQKQKIPQGELDNLCSGIRSNDQYPMEATKTRNVLMVGRTRSGKSTAVGVLKDPCYEPKEMSIFSDTVDPKFQSFSIDDKQGKFKYTLNMVDTPGLKEVAKIGADARSDQVILNTINYCLKNEITKINTMLIFISFELGVGRDDLDSFQTFVEKFSHSDIEVGIVITRSEDKNEKWKQTIVSQLKEHPYFSKILEKSNFKILFSGCVDAIKNETLTSIDDAQNLYFSVYEMREELIKFIFGAENQVMLVDLPIASGIKQTVLECFSIQHAICDYLEKVTDWDLAHVKQKLVESSNNIDCIAKNNCVLLEGEMSVKFSELVARMKKVCAMIPDAKDKLRFCGQLNLASF